jgi:hypothetical protein
VCKLISELLAKCNVRCCMLNDAILVVSKLVWNPSWFQLTTGIIWAQVRKFERFGACFYTCALIIWSVLLQLASPWPEQAPPVRHPRLLCFSPSGLSLLSVTGGARWTAGPAWQRHEWPSWVDVRVHLACLGLGLVFLFLEFQFHVNLWKSISPTRKV